MIGKHKKNVTVYPANISLEAMHILEYSFL